MTDQMKQARDEKARTYGYNNAIYIDKAMLNKEDISTSKRSLQRTSKREPTGTVTTCGIQPARNLMVLMIPAGMFSL